MARNEKFQQLVKDVAFATLAHRQKKGQAGYVKVRIHNDRQMSAALNLLHLLHSALILCVSLSVFFFYLYVCVSVCVFFFVSVFVFLSAFFFLCVCVCVSVFFSSQNFLSNEDLNKLSLDDGVSLADHVALTIGQYINGFPSKSLFMRHSHLWFAHKHFLGLFLLSRQ